MPTPLFLSLLYLSLSEKRTYLSELIKGPIQDIPLDLIFPLLFDLDKQVRSLATHVLAKGQHPALYADLVRQCESPEREEKLNAIRLLRYYRNDRCIIPLSENLPDPDPTIQRAIAQTIMSLRPRIQHVAAKKIRGLTQIQKIEVLRSFSQNPSGGEIILREGLMDDEPYVRMEAVKSLSRKVTALSSRLLISALKDSFPLVRLIAVKALRERKNPRIIKALSPLTNDPNIDVSIAAANTVRNRY